MASALAAASAETSASGVSIRIARSSMSATTTRYGRPISPRMALRVNDLLPSTTGTPARATAAATAASASVWPPLAECTECSPYVDASIAVVVGTDADRPAGPRGVLEARLEASGGRTRAAAAARARLSRAPRIIGRAWRSGGAPAADRLEADEVTVVFDDLESEVPTGATTHRRHQSAHFVARWRRRASRRPPRAGHASRQARRDAPRVPEVARASTRRRRARLGAAWTSPPALRAMRTRCAEA